MFPRGNDLLGVPKQTFTTALNYMFPIVNPDLVIPSLLSIRRIYFNAFDFTLGLALYKQSQHDDVKLGFSFDFDF